MDKTIKVLWLGGVAFGALMLICTIVFAFPDGGYEMGPNYEMVWTWRALFIPGIFAGFFVTLLGMFLAAIRF